MSSRAAFLKSLRAFLGILGGAPPAFVFASPRGLGCAPSRACVSHFALKLTIILLYSFSPALRIQLDSVKARTKCCPVHSFFEHVGKDGIRK